MKTKVGRMLGVGVAVRGLPGVLLSPLSAQEPKLRDTLKGHTDDGVRPWRSVRTARRWPRGARTRRSSCGTWRRARNRPPSRDTRAWCASVAFSPDGKTLASGSGDKTIKLWDVATGKEQATLKGHTDAVYVRGVQSGRQDAGLGERGQDDQAVGRGDGQGTGHPQGTHGLGVCPWRSARTARRWPRGARTRRSSCGTWRRARNRPPSRGTRTW